MTFTQNTQFNRDLFHKHAAQVANMVGADFSSPIFNKVMDVIEADLEPDKAPMGWKITPVEKARAYYNICNHKSVDMLAVLRNGGLVPDRCFAGGETQAVYRLVEDDLVDGADFNTSSGLCKVWVYTHMAPLEKLHDNKYLPESVRLIEPKLRQHGLDRHFFIGADFEKSSTNIYFPWHPDQQNAGWVQSFAESIGSAPLSPAALNGILATADHTIGLGITFNWQSRDPQRACFYNAAPSPKNPALSRQSLDLRERLREQLPTLIESPTYLYNWSIGRTGEFVKIEKDYSGDFWQHVRTAYGLDPDATHVKL